MRKSRAFTLIELMVVVAIISLLIGITMPSLKEARRVARKTVCQKNLQQIGTGIHEYLQAHRDIFFYACETPWFEVSKPPDEQRPSLPIVLMEELHGTDVFECPADQIINDNEPALRYCKRYYDYDQFVYKEPNGKEHHGKESQTSYEWFPFLNGKRLTFKGIWYEYFDPPANENRRALIKPDQQNLVADYAAFHGGDNRHGSLNTLYLDLRVDSH